MSISDRIAVMEKGVVQQFEVPQKMYLNPGNLFVAQFLGTPQINIFDVTVKGGKIMCGDVVLREGCRAADGKYKAGIRAEAFNVSENGILVKATHVPYGKEKHEGLSLFDARINCHSFIYDLSVDSCFYYELHGRL